MTIPTLPVTKPTKAIVAGIGSTITAITTMWATLSLVAEDNGIDAGEIGIGATAVLTCIATIRAVWQVRNEVKREH
jgi:hypothetical protein